MSGDSLHGRDAELEAIVAALDAVARGERRLLTVRGDLSRVFQKLDLHARTQVAAAIARER